MNYYEKLFNTQEDTQNKINMAKGLEENLKRLKEMLSNCDDIIYREFNVGKDQKLKFATVYAEGLADKIIVNEYVLKNLMILARITEPEVNSIREKVYGLIKDGVLSVSDLKEIDDLNEVVNNVLSGETVLLFDKWDKAIVIASKGWPMRGISEPETDTVIRGSREGFTETLRVNTALVRRRIRDSKFKIKQMRIGRRSKTDVAVLFIDGIVNQDILKTVVYRLKSIEIDGILESGYIEQLIEDNWRSPFPQVQSTERPEKVAAALYEGKVAIIVDNTPFALILPTTFNALIQATEDYNERVLITSIIRFLRYTAMLISVILPALYVAMLAFHPGMIPTELALYIAGNRDGVPFPAVIEALIMEGALELLREAGIRLPGPIGATIGIIGGLVLGQAAVDAGIVSSLMIIVVAITAISSYSNPNYSFAISFRMLRFTYIMAAGFLGLYGLMLAILITLIHLCNLKSFGIPYLSPFIYYTSLKDFKDTFIRVPLHKMKGRPQFIAKEDKDRLMNKFSRDNLKRGEDNNG
ncbi:spore germination protein [Paramaledivibacter caminithermalis]|uniref:Spore germination protein n=1 Tax=Paramaledivibacter caminithermalis (strain DSM 15212 / CIP 107654 / DViRD3) TaxID=1121301 RepID=A0A1M6KGX9_PARC5|nr:spore germination protein [Paramaledivibacter caminithermalis]SHJ58223.1 spore germination protein [Paramaledivibacter caminithermalis DSM 15212]